MKKIGGQTIVINGTKFNSTNKHVYFGNVSAIIVSYTSTQIVIMSPPMAPGLYNLIIPSSSLGNAW